MGFRTFMTALFTAGESAALMVNDAALSGRMATGMLHDNLKRARSRMANEAAGETVVEIADLAATIGEKEADRQRRLQEKANGDEKYIDAYNATVAKVLAAIEADKKARDY